MKRIYSLLILLSLASLSFADNTRAFIIEETSIQDYLKVGLHDVEILLVNTGNEVINEIQLNYQADNGEVISSVLTQLNLAVNGSQIIQHTTPWMVSEGLHSVSIWIDQLNSVQITTEEIVVVEETTLAAKILAPRETLIEVFTSSTCGPCTPANANLQNNVLPNVSNAVVVKYQQDFPGVGDPYATGESRSRARYYYPRPGQTSWGIPAANMDGNYISLVNLTPTAFSTAQGKNSVVTIDITKAEYTNNIITVEGSVNATVDIPNGDYSIHVVVYERETTGNRGSNGERVFHDVMMDMLTGSSGKRITSMTAGTPVPFLNAVTVNANIHNIEDMWDLGVAVWLQDNGNKGVANASKARVKSALSAKEVEQAAFRIDNVYPNPSNGLFNVNYVSREFSNGHLQVVDALGKVVFNENLKISAGLNQQELDLNSAQAGIYSVRISNGESVLLKKIVVE